MAPRKKQNYIDNEAFSAEMEKHRAKVDLAREAGLSPKVPVSDFIGDCFHKIATNLSHRPNFSRYSYKDEMVGDALETMISNAHHFNPNAITRSGKPNAFSYFTLVAWRAFLHRIKREKKEEYTKYKYTENSVLTGTMSHGESDNRGLDGAVDLNTEYYQKLAERFEGPPKKKKATGLDKFVVEE